MGFKLPALVVHLIWPIPVPVHVSATHSLLLAWWFVKVWWITGLQWGVISAFGWQRSHFRSVLCPGCGRVPVIAAVCRRGERTGNIFSTSIGKKLKKKKRKIKNVKLIAISRHDFPCWLNWALALTWYKQTKKKSQQILMEIMHTGILPFAAFILRINPANVSWCVTL